MPNNRLEGKTADLQLVGTGRENELTRLVNHFLKSEQKELNLAAENPQKIWEKFKKKFKLIKAAGGIVQQNGQYLFIFRRGKWDLPKGKIDKSETKRQAAIREVEEECGIKGLEIKRKLQNTWHIYQSGYADTKGEWVLKKTSWFEMKYRGNMQPIPQLEEDITEARWLASNEIGIVMGNTYPNLKELIYNFIGSSFV